uniref:hypothetical protein n=1 Tax=Pedobacter sp. TaxID=1411316 RepID=UPI003D7F6439
ARPMLVGRSLEINANIYSRLMIDAPAMVYRTRLIGLHFFYLQALLVNSNILVSYKKYLA